MKRRPITEKEEYIRDAILNQYKRAHKYEIKTLMFFLVSCIFAIFLSINVLIAIFKFNDIKILIIRIVVFILFALYSYISGLIVYRNRKDLFNNKEKGYKENTIFIYKTKLIEYELDDKLNDIGKVLNEEKKEVYGILYGHEKILKDKKNCYLVSDPVEPTINYIMPIFSEEDEDE